MAAFFQLGESYASRSLAAQRRPIDAESDASGIAAAASLSWACAAQGRVQPRRVLQSQPRTAGMTIFLLASSMLIVTALVVVTWPLWRWKRASDTARRDVDVVGRLMHQLKDLHAGGALTDEQFAASKIQLERRLIDALARADTTTTDASNGQRPRSLRLPLALAAFMLVVTAGGYWLVGSPRYLSINPGGPVSGMASQDTGTEAPPQPPHELTTAQIEDVVDKLATRLQSNPDDAKGWTMLARSRVALGQHDKAAEAFSRAERLLPRDADLLADHADALAMAHGRSLEGEPSELLRRALEIDPLHAKALALAGTAAFDRKDYKAAVRYWETLARTEPSDGPFAGQVRDGIAEARQLAGMPPAAASASGAAPAPAAKPVNATLSGTVTLASALAGKVSPDDVLFVFARAVDGPRMPVAIVRKRVSDLPLQFRLDDSMAMSPEANLSSVRRVIVGARISHSGNAMPQQGDLQGMTPVVQVGASGLRLEIDQVIAN
jgi:cytochrome c-type biogenesis protein CcmH